MLELWILDDKGLPVPESDVNAWAEWYERHDEARRVAWTELGGGVAVSTVFLGAAVVLSPKAQRRLWETLVFGGPLDGEQGRYATLAEAKEGHERICRAARPSRLRVALFPLLAPPTRFVLRLWRRIRSCRTQ